MMNMKLAVGMYKLAVTLMAAIPTTVRIRQAPQ